MKDISGMVSVELLNLERATCDRLRDDGDKLRAEIELLQTALVKQTEQHAYPCSPHCAGYLREMAAQAENARLRAALATIRADCLAYATQHTGAAQEGFIQIAE